MFFMKQRKTTENNEGKEKANMNKKEGFLLFIEQKALFEKMTNEQAGILIKAIYEYEDTGKVPELEFGLDMAFTTIKTTLDKNRLKYEEVSKKRSAAARSRNKNKQKEQMQANVDFDSKSNCIDNEYECDNEYDSDYYHYNDEIKNNEDDSCVDDPIEFFKKNFNDNNNLSDYQKDELNAFSKNIGNELVLYAMKKCVNYNATNLQYLKSIINNWQKSKVTTVEEAEKIDQEFQKKKNLTPKKFEYQKNEFDNLEGIYEN